MYVYTFSPPRHYICAGTSKHPLLYTVTHELQQNLTLWPGGMKSFADYLHSKGMQLSVYTDAGTHNCCGYICSNKMNRIGSDLCSSHVCPDVLRACTHLRLQNIHLLGSLALLDTRKLT